jgi:heat-inducible transcriptional repressor
MAENGTNDRTADALSERERSILHHVVDQYIRTAVPIGSRFISRRFESHLSPATIRNVMADLEELGYLSHPHTSAGRVPTDLGYRYYVDFLMEVERLREKELREIQEQLESANDHAELLRETSKLLSKISRQLSVVSSPHISSGILEKLELIPLSSVKLLVVLSIRTGIVKTIMLEIHGEIERRDTERVSSLLNQRLAGLTLQQIRDSFVDRVRDMQDDKTGLVRLFIDSVDQIYAEEKNEKLHISGTQNIIEQPEFIDPRNFRSVIEMIENEEIIVHLLEKKEVAGAAATITIGSENTEQAAKEYSVVTTAYDLEGVSGHIGIIGPRRMHYAKLIPLVEHVARTIARMMAS